MPGPLNGVVATALNQEKALIAVTSRARCCHRTRAVPLRGVSKQFQSPVHSKFLYAEAALSLSFGGAFPIQSHITKSGE